MSVDPGGLESGSDPQDPVMDIDEESTLDDNEVLDPIDEDDNTNDPEASVYDTSWVPDDRPSHRTDYGNTLTEMRDGESLDRRLAEDEPDVLERELGDPVDQILGQRADTEDDPDYEEDPDARLATEADEATPDVAAVAGRGGRRHRRAGTRVRGAAAAGRPAGRAGRGPGVRHREGHDRLRRGHLRRRRLRRGGRRAPHRRAVAAHRPPRGTSRATCNWYRSAR